MTWNAEPVGAHMLSHADRFHTVASTKVPQSVGGPQIEARTRADLLGQSTPPLEHAVEVTGTANLTLYASSSAVGDSRNINDCGLRRWTRF